MGRACLFVPPPCRKERDKDGAPASGFLVQRCQGQGWVGVAGGRADACKPVASKVRVFASPSAPWAGSFFPLNSNSSAPTLPALTTISLVAWMVFSVGALKLLPWRI